MKRNSKSQEIVCPNPDCGKTFTEPITATNLSLNPSETYPACPFCLSRLEEEEIESEDVEEKTLAVKPKLSTILKKDDKPEKEKPTFKIEVPKKIEIPKPTCPYSFGYLKKRPKNTAIPEECMLCPDMMKCLL